MSLAGATPDHLVKRNEYGDLPWWRRLGRSKARRDLARAVAIAARGVPTPMPVVVGETRRGPLLERCHALVPWIADAIDLREARETGVGTPAERRRCAAALGALIRRMHDAGIDQRDLAPNNFLWRPAAEPSLLAIDFERARVGAAVPARARIDALAKLDRHCAGAPASERMRFLRAYCAGDRAAARSWWRAIEPRSAALLRRDAARWRRTATRRGRRFEPIAFSIGATAWRGWARHGRARDVRAAIERPETAGAGLLLRALEPASVRGVADAFGRALALHQRAVLPEPIAACCGGGRAWLLLAAPSTPLGSVDPATDRAALVVLLDRLMAWGGVAASLRIDAVARAGTRLVLLDPGALDLASDPLLTGRRAAARQRAESLLVRPIRDGRGERDGSRP